MLFSTDSGEGLESSERTPPVKGEGLLRELGGGSLSHSEGKEGLYLGNFHTAIKLKEREGDWGGRWVRL